ncbi:MAG: adenylate/guanylate cyclase domain-containing protein [Candidatus Brocadiae bacterium]|nr:adenylate/guanylate cyclase domain-containing protein [Candidatus Brocadiia bacterium]
MAPLSRLRHHLHTHSRTRRLVEGLGVALAVGLLFASLGRTESLDNLERRTLDQRFRTYADRVAPHPDILVLPLTDGDLEAVEQKMKRGWPWDRQAYAIAIEWLNNAGAKAIFLDFSYQDSHGSFPASDTKFAEAVRKAGNVHILVTLNSPVQRSPDRLPALHERSAGTAPPWMKEYPTMNAPLPELVAAARSLVSPGWGADEKDPDEMGRSYAVGHAHQGRAYLTPAVALAAHALDAPVTFEDGAARIGGTRIPLDPNGTFRVRWHARQGKYNPKGFTLGGVIANRQKSAAVIYDPADFRGKIVLIGASAEGLGDIKSTPVEKSLYGVEVHATALDTILTQAFVRRVGPAAFAALIFAHALLAGVGGLLLRIRWLLVLVLLAGGAHVAGAWHLLGAHNLWVDVVAPLGSLLVATTGSALVNFAVEDRQRRDIRAKFGTYLTPEYVRLLEDNPSLFSLGGVERVGTAFFSDLSGFTAMSEKMTPGELVARMNEYLTLMTRSIKRFNGTVDKYEGDAIVAFWNAPIEQPDHALLACRAALDNQRELAQLRERWKASFGVSVVARIGINTGGMIFGNMGSEDKFNYTMMGDPVNLAARLESANKDYGTFLMIGQGTWELVKDSMECRELDLIKVKGKQIPVTVYELLCEKGSLGRKTGEMLERYTLGLQAYRMKQFLAAERLFGEALEIDPEDGPSKLYLERSRHLVAKPPEASWTYIYEKKDK